MARSLKFMSCCSHSSQVDDFFEEQKLSSNRRVSFPWQPELWAGSGEEVGGGGEGDGGGGGGGDTVTHLRELLKTEREQKVCIYTIFMNTFVSFFRIILRSWCL